MKTFLKVVFCLTAGALMWTSCQKDKTTTPDNEATGAYTKAAVEVDVPNAEALWGTPAKWLGSKGVLDFLVNARNLWDTQLGKEIAANPVPSGFEVIADDGSFVYVTCVGGDASFNNILGYYTYTKDDKVDAEFLYKQILGEDPDTHEQYYRQVVFRSPGKGMLFGKTYQISDNGNPFPQGTVVGFYLIPNAAGMWKEEDGLSKIKPRFDKYGKPMFLATDKIVNTGASQDGWVTDGKLSHIVGRSVCGDFVIAFEDLNTLYSKTSDEDFNDFVIVVGCRADNRTNQDILPYPKTVAPYPTQLPVLGENECDDYIICEEGYINMKSLINKVSYKYSPNYNDAQRQAKINTYQQVWDTKYKQYLDLTGLNGTTPLYAKIAYKNAGYANLVGWFNYTPGQTITDIINNIAPGTGNTRTIKSEYVIAYTSENVNVTNNQAEYVVNLEGQTLHPIGGAGKTFSDKAKIGFFILAYTNTSNNYWQSGDYRYQISGQGSSSYIFKCTTIPNSSNVPTAIMVSSECSSLIVALEDVITNADRDYNDIIFHVTNNTYSLTWESQADFLEQLHDQFFPLPDLNKLFEANGLRDDQP